MPRIAADVLERLKAEVSVQRLVSGSGVQLKASGKDWLGRCVFHEDSTASLVVTPSKNLWHCFGCGAAGGPIDWVMRTRGVSFRHAVELLKEGVSSLAAPSLAANPATPVKLGTVRTLAAPVQAESQDSEVLAQVVQYYQSCLKQAPEALAYLASRGLEGEALAQAIDAFQLGYANRTLGLRLPHKNRKAGAELRGRLEALGVYRESGHEHLNGSVVVPLFDQEGKVVNLYGRKITAGLRPGTALHLYLPGPREGLFNVAAFAPGANEELIVCEALMDALSFWCAGFKNVTSAYGVEGVTPQLLEAIKHSGVKRVLIAFDRDEAGERGAAKLADKVQALGLEAWQVLFPKGMDANEYASKVQPANKSLGLLIRKAIWLGQGAAPDRGQPVVEVVTNCDHLAQGGSVPASPAAKEEIAVKQDSAQDSTLPAAAVPVLGWLDDRATVSEQEVVVVFGEEQPGQQKATPAARRWRVRGLAKNTAVGCLKVNVMVSTVVSAAPASSQPPVHPNTLASGMHLDTLDLYAARARAVFVAQAAAELALPENLLKADLGRLLLKLEALQDEAIQQALAPQLPVVPQLNDDEVKAALDLLKAPDLVQRIAGDFAACGVVGEATNVLVGYLAGVSRLLDRPLGLVIQSSSAAGKSSLMQAVLSFVPSEAKTQYSAMTGQSLFYMGQTSLKHKILALAEEEGAAKASYAMKLLQSEGELTIASTGSDPKTGNLITQAYRVEGPTMLMMTTTALDVDEELLNRCMVLTVDEERSQTQRIHALQREKRTLAGLAKRQHKAAIEALHQNAQRLLKPYCVVNPYAEQLTFLDDRTRTRRDHEKYLTLIDAITLVHQHQRQIKSAVIAGKAVEYVVVSVDDIALANRLAHEVLGRSLDELPPHTRRCLGAIQAMVQALAKENHCALREVRFTRAQVRAVTGQSDTRCRLHLERLAQLEYVLVHRGQRGQSYEYELLHDGPIEAGGVHLAGLIDVAAIKEAITKEEVESAPTLQSSPRLDREFAPSTPAQGLGDAGGELPSKNFANPSAEPLTSDWAVSLPKASATPAEKTSAVVPYMQAAAIPRVATPSAPSFLAA